LFRDCL